MRVAGRHSHKDGERFIRENHPVALAEVEQVIASIDAESCRLKRSEEASREHEMIFSPKHLNALFDWYFFKLGWEVRPLIKTHDENRSGSREMDFLKDKVGVEVQMGKYSFLTYDIVAKMVIFRNLGVSECGVEICPMASMLPQMSTGIGAFEQVAWDLKARGVADIDLPVLVLGIEPGESARASGSESGEAQPQSVNNFI